MYQAGGGLDDLLPALEFRITYAVLLEEPLDLVGRELRSRVRVGERRRAPLAEERVVRVGRGAHARAAVARVGLDPDAGERRGAQYLPVEHAVEAAAAREHDVLAAGDLVRVAQDLDHRVLVHELHRRRDVLMALRELGLRCPHRPFEERAQLLRRHAIRVVVDEVAHVEVVAAVVFEVDDLQESLVVLVFLAVHLAVRREAHDLVLGVVDAESEVCGDRGVEEAEGVRELDVLDEVDVVVLADADGGRAPLSDAVDGHDRRLLERAEQERGRGVREVVLDVQDIAFVLEPFLYGARDAQLLVDPRWRAVQECLEAARERLDVLGEQALELEEWFLVERDVLEVIDRDALALEAPLDGVDGE